MQRRDFIKTSCGFCVAVGAGILLGSLASCNQIPIYKTEISNKKITVPIILFDKTDLQIIRPKGYENDIALRKNPEGKFTAILMRCTHADNGLMSSGNNFQCNLHGSTFDKDGAVTKGPAEYPLKRFNTEIKDGQIIIVIN